MKYLYPQEFNKLSELEKDFLRKPALQQKEHSHEWEQVFIMNPGGGMFNAHVFKVCFGCGKRIKIQRDQGMNKEIKKIIGRKM